MTFDAQRRRLHPGHPAPPGGDQRDGLEPGFPIVSEMADERSRRLAEVAEVDDVIVSENVISLLFAQISQNHHLADVFTQLFFRRGRDLPAAGRDPRALNEEVSFATMTRRPAAAGNARSGDRSASQSDDPDLRVSDMTINPPKSWPGHTRRQPRRPQRNETSVRAEGPWSLRCSKAARPGASPPPLLLSVPAVASLPLARGLPP